VDDYRDHLYLAVHSARWDKADDQPLLKELDMLIGERYLVTYHEEPTRGVTKAREVLERRPELLARGPDELLNFILDVMVDNYFPIIETLQEQLDDLEERLFRTATQRLLAEILRLKRGMSALRRIVGPQRDTILSLTREEFTGIRPETRPYLRDVYDRMTRISDLLDSYRDELAGLLEIYATQVSNRLNETMKVLTIITVIIMPVTLIASIYGMNFRMPEQQLPGYWGYALALSLMVSVGFGTYWLPKKSKWM
jgi:magnesium transporter